METTSVDRRSYKAKLETREIDNARHIVGYAAVFNAPSELIYGFREIIRPGAFTEAIAKSDIRALFNHDDSLILGRTKAGTLKVWEDERGLAVDITLPNTQYAHDLLESINRGDVDAFSFAFTVGQDRFYKDPLTNEVMREIEYIERLFDVSPVVFPAYPATVLSTRALDAYKHCPDAAGAGDRDNLHTSQPARMRRIEELERRRQR